MTFEQGALDSLYDALQTLTRTIREYEKCKGVGTLRQDVVDAWCSDLEHVQQLITDSKIIMTKE